MVETHREFSHIWEVKDWDPRFSIDEDIEIRSLWHEMKDIIRHEGDKLTTLLDDSPEDGLAEAVRDFCRERMGDFNSDISIPERRLKAAWVDERSIDGPVRKYQWLSALALYRILSRERLDRRLVYVHNLDISYIMALLEPLRRRQLQVLRRALRNHISFKSCIRVNIESTGFPKFELELHLPNFRLIIGYPAEIAEQPRKGRLRDVSFLRTGVSKTTTRETAFILQNHYSLVIHGHHNQKWDANSFEINDFAHYGLKYTDGEEEDSNNEDLEDEEFQHDPNGGLNGVLEADIPIWDARENWLRIFDARSNQILQSAKYLIPWLERSIKNYKEQHSWAWNQESDVKRNQVPELKKIYDWTQPTIELLSDLKHEYSELLQNWETFRSRSGDIGYFSDLNSSTPPCRGNSSLRSINAAFEELHGFVRGLDHLLDSSNRSAANLQLRLQLQSYDAAQHNAKAAEGNAETAAHNTRTTGLTFCIVSPIALTTAYFSMPQAVIPFQAGPRTFLIGIFVVAVALQIVFQVSSRCIHLWDRFYVSREKMFSRRASAGVFGSLLMGNIDLSEDVERDNGVS